MKYTGRIIIISFSFIVSMIESFFEETSLLSIIEALFFALIAYAVGWTFDRASYYRKMAEMSEQRYRNIIESLPEPILIYQKDKIVFVNDILEKLVGVSADRIIGRSIFEFVLPEFHSLVHERIQKANAERNNFERMEIKIIVNQNKILDIEVTSIAIIYDNKPSIEVFIKDVTERKTLEEKSRKNEELFRFITEYSTDVIYYINPSGDYEFISPSCKQVLGYSQNEIIGESIFHFFHTEETGKISKIFNEANSNIDFGSFPHRFRKKDGTFVWLETSARTIRNNKKELVGIVGISRDIDERIHKEKTMLESNKMLLYLSNMDSLTDIPNRRYFEETFESEWNRALRHSMPLSALMIDIDYFKHFNDTYGHQAGDKCIKEIAHAIKNTLKRPGDFVARYGGEEFVVLLPAIDKKGAKLLSESILESVRALNIKTEVSEVADYVTISIGCAAIVPAKDKNPEELIKLADLQLYSAKESGRNQVK